MVTFDAESHTYTVDGVQKPSVTEVIRFLAYDYKSDKTWLMRQAAERGTAVHEYTAVLDYGETPDELPPEWSGYGKAYRRFLADYKPEWTHIEAVLGHPQIAYAGTVDRFGMIGGVPTVLDIKSGQMHDAALVAQLTAYATLLAELKLLDPTKPYTLLGLKLDKDGTYIVKEYTADPALLAACAKLHTATQKKKRGKKDE